MSEARIRERGYRRYQGARSSPGGRFRVVARQLLRSARKQRAVTTLLILTAFPTVILSIKMYVASKLLAIPGDEQVYDLLLQPYGTFFLGLAMAMRVGGGSVADEARAGGFQFYFSRPLTHAHYLTGKLVGVGLLVAAVTAAPAMLLSLTRLALSQGGDATHALSLLVRAAALGALQAAVLSCVVVTLSTLIRRRGLVQGAFAALIFLPWLVGSRFRDFTRTPWPALPSLPTHFDALGRWLFGMPNEIGDRAMPPVIALAVLALVAASAVTITLRRIRRAEVVAG